MMYNCYIIDDEPLAIDVVEEHLKKLDQFNIVGKSTDPVAAFVAIKNLRVDLLFVDIEMPGFNGLELVRSMKNRPEIIITTAYREFAVEGFELSILDYLVKPIAFDRFMKAIDKFLEKKVDIKQKEDTRGANSILVRANRKLVKIDLSTILYVEGLKDYVKIVLNTNETLMTKESIGNFHKHLNDQFIRIHKSFVVALDKITAITSYDVELGNIELPIGRKYKDDLIEKVGKK